MIELSLEATKEFLISLFLTYGFSQEDSIYLSDSLLAADLAGVESHGIQRMIRYDEAIHCGMVNACAIPQIVFETPISAVIDGDKAMGQLVSRDAMKLAISKARQVGIGMTAVRNSNHFGMAGAYAAMAAEQDLVGVAMTNSEAIMVPTNGKKAMLGTNPIAVAFPAAPIPFCFDAATTVVTRGKLEVYHKRELCLDGDWAVDPSGQISRNPAQIIRNIRAKAGGGILPLGGAAEVSGGHKGYGFGIICEIFSSILAGGPPSYQTYLCPELADTSHCFWAIDYGIFGDKASIRTAASRLLMDLRNSPKAEGQQRIYTHGEKEQESIREKRQKNCIPASEKTLKECKGLGAIYGIPCHIEKTGSSTIALPHLTEGDKR